MEIKMNYIILYVDDTARSVQFYHHFLQLPIRGEHGTYIEFSTGNTILAINTKEDITEITGFTFQERTSSNTFELGFVVDDVPATIEFLRKKGVPVLVEPIEKPWGQIVAYVSDPDGHYIEICSAIE